MTGVEHNLASSATGIQGIAQSRKTPSLVYAMHNGMVFKSTDSGTTWTVLSSASATGMSGLSISNSMNRGMGWSSPLDTKIILFASQSGTAVKTVFSKDGGVTWKNVTGTGANLFPSTAVNGMAGTEDGKMVFASTNMGPYVFIVNEEAWYPLAVDPKVPIFFGQIVYVQKYAGKEYARFSTWGQGVWDFEIKPTALAIAQNKADDLLFKVYPNPTADKIYLSLGTEYLFANVEIDIYNQLGQKMYHHIGQYDPYFAIDMSQFSNGIYFCSVKSGSSEKTQKIIVRH
jgi:hypothetical protein